VVRKGGAPGVDGMTADEAATSSASQRSSLWCYADGKGIRRIGADYRAGESIRLLPSTRTTIGWWDAISSSS
jgi:hypothetical protein